MWSELLIAANRRQRAVTARLASLLERLPEQAWLAVLRDAELQAITDRFYRSDGHLRQREYNLGGLNFLEARLAREHFAAVGRVLVLGAGAGREAFGLAREGFAVDAVDCNPALLEAAAAWAEALDGDARARLRLLQRAPGDLTGLEAGYDAVLIGLGAYTHVVGRPARVALLEGLATLAGPEAALLLSFYGTRGGGRGWLLGATRALARVARNPRIPEPHERLGDTYDRWFAPGEVEGELAAAGWRPVEAAERGLRYLVARRS